MYKLILFYTAVLYYIVSVYDRVIMTLRTEPPEVMTVTNEYCYSALCTYQLHSTTGYHFGNFTIYKLINDNSIGLFHNNFTTIGFEIDENFVWNDKYTYLRTKNHLVRTAPQLALP